MKEYTSHQFSLFPFTPPKPKVKISTERIRAAQDELAKGKDGDTKTIVQGLRDLQDSLERWENKLSSKVKISHGKE